MHRLQSLTFSILTTIVFTWPIAARLGTHLAGPPGDNMIFHWNFWWFRQALWIHPRWPFHTDMILHPRGAPLAFHTTALLGTIPGSLMGLVLPLPVAFNLVVLSTFVLSSWVTCHLALRLLRRNRLSRPGDVLFASFASIAYAFSPFHFSHLGHLNILTMWVLPLLALAFLRAHERASVRRYAALGASLGCCGLADGYYLLMGLLLAALLALVFRRGMKTPSLRMVLAALAAFVLVGSPVIGPAIAYGTRGLEELRAGGADEFVADVLAYVLPSPLHPLWGQLTLPAYGVFTGNLAEKIVFPLFSVWILAILGWRRDVCARKWGWIGLVFLVLSLGPYLHISGRSAFDAGWGPLSQLRLPLPKLLLDALPIAAGARAASRFAAVVQLALVISAMFGLARVAGITRHRNRTRLRFVWVALLATAFECAAWPLPTTPIRIPRAYAALREDARRHGPGALLEIPPVHAGDKVYQLYQTVHGLPILGGRLARAPHDAYAHLHRDLFLDRTMSNALWSTAEDSLSLDGLDSLGIRYVALHTPFPPSAGIGRVLAARFEPLPTLSKEVVLLRRRTSH